MKKLIIGGLAVLLIFTLVTCDGLTPQGINDELTDWVVSPDGKSLTLYLEGGVPISKNSRALTTESTRMGHDFYEVVFVRNIGGSETIARASWGLGESVSISGVGRGVSYDSVSVPADTPAPGAGSAVLFVGRKSDMTLLAVGSITAVDGGAANVVFTANTKSVTFSVAALQAGTSLTLANSSFLTSDDNTVTNINATNTEVINQTIGDKSFPLFKIAKNEVRAAQYQLGSAGSYAGNIMGSLATNLNSYINGIRLDAVITGSTAPQASFSKREPRYPIGGGRSAYSTGIDIDKKTTIAPLGDTASALAGDALPNPLEFVFDSNGADKSIFSFYFEIPVYAISNGTGTQAAKIWNVKPAYGTSIGDLDDGLRGSGGCILIGTGLDEEEPIDIIVK